VRVRVSILGHFGEGVNLLNGQTVKTKIITEELQSQLGQDQVLKIDTHGGWKTLLKAPFQVFRALKNSTNVLIFPAHNGLRVYAPLLSLARLFFKKRKIYYVVIGGWLPQFLMRRKCLGGILRQFDGIFVETNTMKSALGAQGFENVYVMPNCKKLTVLSEDELVYPSGVPYKLCTFSRVMKEKGIETAVNIITKVNDRLGYIAYSLDIYGQVDTAQVEWFENLKKQLPDYIRYCGCVDANRSVEVLQKYFALLFPTHFYTEGIPGTIIDAYAAGIPVISAKWESYSDVVDEGITGIGYDFDDADQFERALLEVAQNPNVLLSMKENCVRKAKDYIPESAIQIMTEKFGGGYNLYPLKFCTFSRVMREKGIEDAVNAVVSVNTALGFQAFSLDIYGQVDGAQTEWFDSLQKEFPSYIRYGGLVPFDKSVDVLKDYFALLFPTYYEGEGFAGTLIDAYSAGVPVIASDWKYNTELVNENVGIVYPTGDQLAFVDILKATAEDPTLLLCKKRLCLIEADKYRIDKAVRVLIEQLEDD